MEFLSELANGVNKEAQVGRYLSTWQGAENKKVARSYQGAGLLTTQVKLK
jgi:hypothetical protein